MIEESRRNFLALGQQAAYSYFRSTKKGASKPKTFSFLLSVQEPCVATVAKTKLTENLKKLQVLSNCPSFQY